MDESGSLVQESHRTREAYDGSKRACNFPRFFICLQGKNGGSSSMCSHLSSCQIWQSRTWQLPGKRANVPTLRGFTGVKNDATTAAGGVKLGDQIHPLHRTTGMIPSSKYFLTLLVFPRRLDRRPFPSYETSSHDASAMET